MEILFTTTKKFNIFAYLIKLILGTKYSHVALRVWDIESNRNLVYHSSIKGVTLMPENKFLNSNKVIHSKTIEINHVSKTEVLNFCEDSINKSYGFLTIIGLLFKRVFGIKNKIGKDGNKTFICSEFLAQILKIVRPVTAQFISDDIDPKELYVLVRSI